MFSYLKSRTPLVQPAISFHHQNIKRINSWIYYLLFIYYLYIGVYSHSVLWAIKSRHLCKSVKYGPCISITIQHYPVPPFAFRIVRPHQSAWTYSCLVRRRSYSCRSVQPSGCPDNSSTRCPVIRYKPLSCHPFHPLVSCRRRRTEIAVDSPVLQTNSWLIVEADEKKNFLIRQLIKDSY